MKKLMMLSVFLMATFFVSTSMKADTMKVNSVTKKRVILEGTQYGTFQIDISFRTGTNQVLGVTSPHGTVEDWTYDSGSATISKITMVNFKIYFSGEPTPYDASGDYDVW